ncbi:hypothetical protein CAPTEDRAFT_184694 [Capitella teleta]|uniref:Major facilitator superfamily (MFS) profile domain-containing protein n=1 Tax=Capitella teleta TaxID=283909 RepID=R7VJK0_CAPTE|nr:hypothetical protein CAPTEDRAFT_184694 [Capitella teleta]|eukprot:ELU18772.1 hypothetical protein CAPTEDRAFT_184694 [Capitella teleta]
MGWLIPIINVDIGELWQRLKDKVHEPDKQRRLVLVIVCIALLLDNMLYMVIVPIIPVFLRSINAWQPEPIEDDFQDLNLTHLNLTKHHLFPLATFNGEEDASVGILFASKAIVQLMVNPLSGTLIDRMGYDRPMILGLFILFLSTGIFAFGTTYFVLFFARSLQGVGSAFADTAGLAMIADRYKEEHARSKAQGIALAFISFGCLFAPPFGGVLYEFAGKAVPFLLLSLLALVDGGMLYLVMQPQRKERQSLSEEVPKGTPIYKLIMDPYILVCAGALVMANVSLAFLEPTIALWMKGKMNASEWEIGMVWLPAFFPHVAGVYLTVKLLQKYPNTQWMICAVGLVVEAISCLIIPFCTNYGAVIVPIMVNCFGIALVDTAILPLLGYIVDIRHTSVYGSVYAIADISYSLAYAFGPIVAGGIVASIGFTWLNIGIFLATLLYAPLLFTLRNVKRYDQFENEEDGEDAVIQVSNTPGGNYKTYMMNNLTGSTPKDELAKEDMANGGAGQHTLLGNGMTNEGAAPVNPFYQNATTAQNVKHIRYDRDSVEDDSDFQSFR